MSINFFKILDFIVHILLCTNGFTKAAERSLPKGTGLLKHPFSTSSHFTPKLSTALPTALQYLQNPAVLTWSFLSTGCWRPQSHSLPAGVPIATLFSLSLSMAVKGR